MEDLQMLKNAARRQRWSVRAPWYQIWAIEVEQRFSLEEAFTTQEKGFIVAEACQINKGEIRTFCVFKLSIWHQ